MVEETSAQNKGKTKAKQRYLKRKKERRKLNKKSKPSVQKLAIVKQTESESESEDDNEDESENDRSESPTEEVIAVVVAEEEKLHKNESQSEKRPKKRRKIVAEPSPPPPPPSESEQEDDNEMNDSSLLDESISRKSPTPPTATAAALPSFPLPVLPDAPSKSTLALQGLDRALVDAEIVSPTTMLPISEGGTDVDQMGLSERMRRRLNELGVMELFAVQTALLPFLLPKDPFSRALYQPYNPPRDVCVSAPTGSGKTLSYAVPIVEILSTRIVTRLRALVILPTRDLVTQVRETFEAISKGRKLKIGTATGQHSFSHEQAQLIADQSSSLSGGSSKVDILICTPGRLIDHLNETPNFSLQHLRFLVIDEADRLLAQSFQDWLVRVLSATRPPKQVLRHSITDLATLSAQKDTADGDISTSPPLLSKHDAVAPAFLHLLPYPDIPSFITERKESSCQKLLFSATLTRDPGKIAALELKDPKYFVVHGGGGQDDNEGSGVLDVVTEKFSMPLTLREHMIVCETSQKPLLFFHLVHSQNVVNAVVFTKSTESTTRLVRLFEFFENSISSSEQSDHKATVIRAYSSDLGVAERRAIFDKFKSQEIQILVCSDLISRGIDISHVSHVVNYDAPVDMRKYIHRAGRTARAGREGDAWTLVEEQEARYFKNMMKEADHLGKIKRLRVSELELEPLVPHYDAALERLKEVYSHS